ncbi:Ada metal-binding domain-containing protein [Niastella populi]|uniref:Metal-binding protein n=1 Tax=Niastella populi TaxID=550983 RepID=A0A1V9F5D1_9BACT|nr:Ada metal-binding domain-containing protein [Niastella populi]OQP53588.1 metal-binding protein [Niastella populi]
MIRQRDLGNDVAERKAAVHRLIRNKAITLGGNMPAKIYGTLSCGSGKKMKAENRVFFHNEAEAIAAGYRPCGHCLRAKYLKWKNALF